MITVLFMKGMPNLMISVGMVLAVGGCSLALVSQVPRMLHRAMNADDQAYEDRARRSDEAFAESQRKYRNQLKQDLGEEPRKGYETR